MKLRSLFLFSLCTCSTPIFALPTPAPAPYGVLPTERQLAWHDLEAYAFIHFTVNTFTDKEWGYGDEAPALFNPTAFDAEQIATTVKDAGLSGLILTAKHHDGFCLWPSAFTDHNISQSPYRAGQGDIVGEMADACRRNGLKFGIYLSPWDRNHPVYGSAEYITYYRNQLKELLTTYGPIFEIWFDGANGGDGYYGGAKEMRQINRNTYYDWANTWSLVRRYQPEAVIFSDGGPDVRWCGNEKGYVAETSWATINAAGNMPGSADPEKLQTGDPRGSHWMPAEVDVSIRPGWFYHAAEDNAVKTPLQLYKIYFDSVGRGANLILNLAPDQRGRIPDIDVEALRQWRSLLDLTFADNLAIKATVTSQQTRGKDGRFSPRRLIDGDRSTYWTTDDTTTTAEVVFEFAEPQRFNVVCLREYLPLGQRIRRVAFDVWNESSGLWDTFSEVQSIGAQRLIPVPDKTTCKIRMRILQADACPVLSEVAFYCSPVQP